MINLPYNCTEAELRSWVESRGFHVARLRIVRDLVSGVSPSFACVQIEKASNVREAVCVLNDQVLRSHKVAVSEIAKIPPTVCSSSRAPVQSRKIMADRTTKSSNPTPSKTP